MDIINNFTNHELCLRSVATIWNRENSTDISPVEEESAILAFLGYKSRTLCTRTTDLGFYSVVLLETKEEVDRIYLDPEIKACGISVNRLIGLNGLRIRDGNNILKAVSSEERVTDDILIELLINLICMEDPQREQISKGELEIIENGISRIVQNGICTMFGSYPSTVRKNGYSDIDLAVSSTQTSSETIRPLQMIINNPKCLLESPLTHLELYTFPQEEVIKAIYACLVDLKEFKEKFEMRMLLVRTPIVILNSKKQAEMKMSYDVSVNNQISVEKAGILSDFISKDISTDNKMKKMMMFMIHWAKTKKILGGVYEDEKLETKFKFNSYIINQMIIHFVQVVAERCLVNTLEEPQNRVHAYNFDELFDGYFGFLKKFFTYFMTFDYDNVAIFGCQLVKKGELSEMKHVNISPLMIVDPLDTAHNVSEYVIPDGIKLFKHLMKRSLKKMLNHSFRITDLL